MKPFYTGDEAVADEQDDPKTRKCEACGTWGQHLMFVRTTNGALWLCRQCLDDINRKNPELTEAIKVITGLRRKLAEAGVEGSPPPNGQATIPALLERAQKAEAALRAMKRFVNPLQCENAADRQDYILALRTYANVFGEK